MMDIQSRNGFSSGQVVSVIDQGIEVLSGTVMKLGSKHAVIFDNDTGLNYDVDYSMIRAAKFVTAQNNVIKEEVRDGNTFVLDRDENNSDGEMSIKYEVTVDGEPLWESEVVVTNVYDAEFGWSPPDDFDEQKLELIQNTAESGFELLVESYQTIADSIQQSTSEVGVDEDGSGKPKDVPAFAPGEEPGGGEGGGGGGAAPMGDAVAPGESVGEEGEEVSEDDVAAAEADLAAEVPADVPAEESTASLEPTFSRKVTSKKDDRLHGNPEHRLNPILREEMGRKGIDSGNTNDLELADELKDFDWGKKAAKRIKNKLENI